MTVFDIDDANGVRTVPLAQRAQRLVNVAGTLLSIALVAGIGWWGYRIAVRDVSGVPVVRALEGPMREAPIQPGGDEAAHQGLSVNTVAAEGMAAPVPDKLTLAPHPADLTPEDVPGLSTEGPVIPAPVPLSVEGPPAPADVIALAGAIAADAPPGDLDADPVALALAEAMGAEAAVAEVATVDPSADAPPEPDPSLAGLRPLPRPAPLADGEAILMRASSPASGTAPATEIDPATLAVGTRLVQLGAFDDELTARTEWDKLSGRFGEMLGGKGRVIQSAQSGGRTFFRLRAHGFENEDDARRFCAALLAEGAACIPVAVR